MLPLCLGIAQGYYLQVNYDEIRLRSRTAEPRGPVALVLDTLNWRDREGEYDKGSRGALSTQEALSLVV